MMEAKVTKKELIELAFSHVYPDVEALIKDVAKEHCIANMGQRLEVFLQGPCTHLERDPGRLIGSCYNAFYQGSESDEMAEGIADEMRHWLKDARRDVGKVQKKGLPLTLANVRDAFEGKGAFAKKPKK